MSISVIIPFTARDEEFLKRARASVDSQTVRPYEVIEVYDSDYRGIPWARNTGLAKARGDVILPLDCDDWIEETYIEKTLKVMEAYPKVGIVSTHMRYFGMYEGKVLITPVRRYEQQLQENMITVCSLVRREAIEQAGPWDDNLKGWEDWDMWLRILKLGWQHAVVPEVLFNYRRHQGGMCAWAARNQDTLKKYLAEKHPGFMEIRKNGEKWNEI